MIVGYRSFGRTSLNYGLSLCIEKSNHIHGLQFAEISAASAHSCDVLLFSLFWWTHFYDYAEFLVKAKVDPRKSIKPLVILGGFNSFNFRSLGNLFHLACVGDGEDWLPKALELAKRNDIDGIKMLSGTYWPGKETATQWQNVKFESYAMNEPGQTTTRIEIARGCKYSCKFCALTYLKKNREGTEEQIKSLIDASPGKRVALFAPDRLSHTNYSALSSHLINAGKIDNAADTRMDSLNRYTGDYQGTLLFGMEGVSQRLRKAVGKSMPVDLLVNNLCRITRESKTGKKNFRFYIILDLPGEKDEDYDEFTEFLAAIERRPEASRMILSPFINTFMPQPLTPVQWGGIHLFEDRKAKMARAIWPHGHGHPWRATIAWTPRMWGATSRLKAQIAIRGDERAEKVFLNLALNPILRTLSKQPNNEGAKHLLKFCTKVGLDEQFLCGEFNTTDPLPWDRIETHVPKHTLIRSWESYHRQLNQGDRTQLHEKAI